MVKSLGVSTVLLNLFLKRFIVPVVVVVVADVVVVVAVVVVKV